MRANNLISICMKLTGWELIAHDVQRPKLYTNAQCSVHVGATTVGTGGDWSPNF